MCIYYMFVFLLFDCSFYGEEESVVEKIQCASEHGDSGDLNSAKRFWWDGARQLRWRHDITVERESCQELFMTHRC